MASTLTKFKYSLHLGSSNLKNFEEFLTAKAKTQCTKIKLRGPLKFKCTLYYKQTHTNVPGWAKNLDLIFEVDKKISSRSAAAAMLFEASGRIFACTFGFGHTFLNNDLRENDFGLIVAANSLSDKGIRVVEKANLGTVLRDYTQAAGITNLRDFDVDGALSLIKKLSGSHKNGNGTLQGGTSISLTSEKDLARIDEVADSLLQLYNSKDYQKSSFSIIEKIKPVLDVDIEKKLNDELLKDLQSLSPNFELGMPEIDTEPFSYLTISGLRTNKKFADISLETYLKVSGAPSSIDDLHNHMVVTHDLDEVAKRGRWSIYKGLVGSLMYNGRCWALNEGKWYSIENALKTASDNAFQNSSSGLDINFTPWPLVEKTKNGGQKVMIYEPEVEYNQRVASSAPAQYLFYDRNLFSIPNNPGPGIEVCDLFDITSRTLIHVKKSGRKSSVISHFLNQGLNSAKLLKSFPKIKQDFLEDLEKKVDPTTFKAIENEFPDGWTVEFKFGDRPKKNGDYTIPFFSRVTFEEVRREIIARGFKDVKISFIRMSNPGN